MKSLLKKMWYALLTTLGGLFTVGLLGSQGYPGVGIIVLFIGLPIALYLIFRSRKPPSAKIEEPVISTTIEVRSSFEKPRSRTVNVGSASYSIPKQTKQKFRFLGKGESVSVHGYELGGLIYLGNTSDQTFDEEPAVINPKLPVKKVNLADPLDYWPNYSRINAAQRNRYLTWLSEGRGDTDELGYVFLYFYGFERYVLRDACQDSDEQRDQNLSDIVGELLRLRKLFAHNRSFESYTTQLLDVIYVVYWPNRLGERKSSFPSNKSIAAQYAIAQVANTTPDTPLDFDWALHWILGFGPVSRTKTIREQYPVLRSLFKAVYETATKGGLKVPSCKTKLQLWVNTASRGLGDVSQLQVPDNWCDPTGLKRPISQLIAVHEEVMPALRTLAKSVAKKDIAGILAAWPSGVPTDSVPKLHQVIQRVKVFIEKHRSPDVATLGKLIGIPVAEKVSAAQMKQMATALETCGYVLVPDPQITSSAIKAEDTVLVYRGSRLDELSPEAQWVALSVHMGCILAMADGNIHRNEKTALQRIVNAHPNSSEREYLEAYLDWRLGHPPSTAGLKKQIDALTDSQRNEIGKTLISVAIADGELPSSEIKQLEKLYGRLGLDPVLVTQYLHTSVVSPTQTLTPDTTDQDQGSEIRLDESALIAHAESTKEVQDVLHRIFQDEPEVEEALANVNSASDVWHEGRLDPAHEELASWLLTGEEWSMDQITLKCRELDLLAQGALEAINDAAFEALGDSLLELGDPVEVYRDVMPA